MVQYEKNPKLSYQGFPNPFSEKMYEGIPSSDAWLFCIYNQIYAISAYVCELADSIQFLFYQFGWTVMSHCQIITGGLDTEVSGFNAQVKINMFWTLTLWICAAPKYWYPLEICFSKDGTLLGKAYMSNSSRSNSGIKAMSQSLWLNATIWQHSFVGHTQCASFWVQMHYSWAPY